MNSFFVDLNHLDLMTVTGKDAQTFLQGQLTCDVESISSEQSCLGASCDNKGRVLSSFRLVKLQDSFFLEMQSGLQTILQTVLEKYMVFYKCSIGSASTNFHRYGLSGDKSTEVLTKLFPALPTKVNQLVSHQGRHLIKISGQTLRFELWSEHENDQDILPILEQELPQVSRSDWERLDIQAGLYQLNDSESGLYTPQLLNFDLAGYIDFNKGCYTGQEIVARMHYRGKVKKRLYHLLIESETKISIGTSIESKDSSKLGKIIKVSQGNSDHQYHSLAILNTDVDKISPNDILVKEHDQARATLLKLSY